MRLAFQPATGNVYQDYSPALCGIGSINSLGLDPQTNQIAVTAANGAATTGAILTGLAKLGVISPMFGPAAPIAAAIAGLTMLGIAIANVFKGCGQTCIIATQHADEIGGYLLQNLRTYISAPVHYRSLQLAALNNFDTAWAALVQACSDPTLADAGKRCISDRQQGACMYKTSPGGWVKDANGNWTWQDFGPNGSGDACWNWFVGMRDPIQNDPTVVPDPVEAGGAGGGLSIGGFSLPFPILLAGGAAAAYFLLSD